MKYLVDSVRFTTVMTIITAIIILTSACQDSSSVTKQEVSSPEESISFFNMDYNLAKEEREATPASSWILSGIDKGKVVAEVDDCIQEVLDTADLDGQEAMIRAGELCP